MAGHREKVIPSLQQRNIAIYCDNSPSIGWVTRLASKSSVVEAKLIYALSLRLAADVGCCNVDI